MKFKDKINRTSELIHLTQNHKELQPITFRYSSRKLFNKHFIQDLMNLPDKDYLVTALVQTRKKGDPLIYEVTKLNQESPF